MNDDELDLLIRRTQPKPEIPASFQREVWARIAVADERSWAGQWRRWSHALVTWMAEPAPAAAVVATMLLLGAGIGHLTLPESGAPASQAAYVSSINPVVAAHATLHP